MIISKCLINGCNGKRDGVGHHVKSRGSGGSDNIWNRASLCRKHHQECHGYGIKTFTEKYPEVRKVFEMAIEYERVNRLWREGKLNEEKLSLEETEILKRIKGK